MGLLHRKRWHRPLDSPAGMIRFSAGDDVEASYLHRTESFHRKDSAEPTVASEHSLNGETRLHQ